MADEQTPQPDRDKNLWDRLRERFGDIDVDEVIEDLNTALDTVNRVMGIVGRLRR